MNYLNIVKNIIKLKSDTTILDAGCGDGRFCHEMNKIGANIIGVDFSEPAIRFAKAFNPDIKFYIQDLTDLNLPHKFDYVVLIETLEHFIPNQIPKILKGISSVLKDEGVLIITVPSTKMPLTKKHYQHFTKDELVKSVKPYFYVENILGYAKAGRERRLFTLLCGIGLFLLPFINRNILVKRYFTYINKYYDRYLSSGNPNECLGLVATCKKQL